MGVLGADVVTRGKGSATTGSSRRVAPAPPSNERLSAVPTDATTLRFGLEDLTRLRVLATSVAAQAGLSQRRTEDLTLVVTEIASNGIRHGTPPRILSMWHQAGAVICQTRNSGPMRELLAGHRRPDPHQLSGRGVWIMRQLCDLVQVRGSETETVVRITVS